MKRMNPLAEHEPTEMKDRIRKIRKTNHFSQVELAKKLGVSQSVISLIESGNASVSIEILKKLSAQFEVSCDWLIYGKERYVKLSTTNDFIPLISSEAEAGYVSNHKDPEYPSSLDLYKIPGFENGQFRIFIVNGDSMAPTIQARDKIICEKISGVEALVEGTINVIITKKNIVVKRIYFKDSEKKSIVLKSDNRHYSDERLSPEEVSEAWVVRSKLTSSFIDDSYGQNDRMDSLERDLNAIKEQVTQLLERKGAEASLVDLDSESKTAMAPEVVPSKASAGVFHKKKNK